MDKERLHVLPIEALQDVARRSGIALVDEIDKASLIDQILEVMAEDRSERERSNNIEMLVKEKKFELNPDDNLENKNLEEFSLPETYGDTRIVLMLRDPGWAFAYWDIGPEHEQLLTDDDEPSRLHLRLFETGVEERFFDIPVRTTDRKWYVNLPGTGCDYWVLLVAKSRANERILCRSNLVSSPDSSIESPGPENELDYVSILTVAGLAEIEEGLGIPQRIISLLDTQYLHLKG